MISGRAALQRLKRSFPGSRDDTTVFAGRHSRPMDSRRAAFSTKLAVSKNAATYKIFLKMIGFYAASHNN